MAAWPPFLADPAIRNTIIGGTVLGLANGSLSAWTPAYIMRTFHLSASATGASYGATMGIMAIVGTLAGGIIAGLAVGQGYPIWISTAGRRVCAGDGYQARVADHRQLRTVSSFRQHLRIPAAVLSWPDLCHDPVAGKAECAQLRVGRDHVLHQRHRHRRGCLPDGLARATASCRCSARIRCAGRLESCRCCRSGPRCTTGGRRITSDGESPKAI